MNEEIIKRYIYNDSEVFLSEIKDSFFKIKSKNEFSGFLYNIILEVENYIINFEKEKSENIQKTEIDFISIKKISNIILDEKIGLKFEGYSSNLSKKIDNLKFSKIEKEYIKNFLNDFQKSIRSFYSYANYYLRKEEVDFIEIFNKIKKDFKENMNFTYKNNFKEKELGKEYEKKVFKIIYQNNNDLVGLEKELLKVKTKKDISNFFEFYKKVVSNRFDYVLRKRKEKDDCFCTEIIFLDLPIFENNKKSISFFLENSIKYFLENKIISKKEFMEIRDSLKKSKDFFSDFVSYVTVCNMIKNDELIKIKGKWEKDFGKIILNI